MDEEGKTSVERAPLAVADASSKSAFLLVIAAKSSPQTGRIYKLHKEENIIGRGEDAEVRLIDEGISRRHARIVVTPEGAARLSDLGSTNGTFVNGERIAQTATLRDGDKIQLGSTAVLMFSLQNELEEQFQRSIYEAATRDGLTQLFNKRYFLERVNKDLAYCTRHSLPLALLMLDVDHFKKVNDTYGHLAGDRVLVHLARRLSEVLRSEDLFARYGGEELAILLRDTAAEEAAICAERCRQAVERAAVAFEGTQIRVTLSVGVATLGEAPYARAEDLIEAADRRLYTAKEKGRNRVESGA